MEPTEKKSNRKNTGITIAVLAVLALIGITVASNKKSADQTIPVDTTSTSTPTTTVPSSSNPTPTATTPAPTPAPTTTSLYKDGTYTATGSYMSPGGSDQIAVTVTLKNDIITDASVTPKPGDNTSARYENIFATNYKQYVVGKDITTLKLTKVSGSSLTSAGFNAAIKQIEAQATL